VIDKREFWAAWQGLCKRFNRPPDADEASEWHDYLSPQLSTEEFQTAARKLWASREFFPRPDDFLDAARGTTEAEAADQWELCRRVMSGDRSALEAMTPAGQKTVRLLGGIDALRQTPLDEVHFRRAEFLRLYDSAEEIARREQGALPWGPEDSRRLKAAAPHLRLLEGGK
jgi:hypothetical protein